MKTLLKATIDRKITLGWLTERNYAYTKVSQVKYHDTPLYNDIITIFIVCCMDESAAEL